MHGSDTRKRLTILPSKVHRLLRRLMHLLDNQHTCSLTYWPCWKCLNLGTQPFNARFSVFDHKRTLQPCGTVSYSLLNVAIQTHPHAEKHCIISWWLMLSPPCGPSAMNHMNCMLVALKRRDGNCYYVLPNISCIIETTEILIVTNVVCEVGKSLETPPNVILFLPFWHCTPLGQVMKSLGFRLQFFDYSLDRCFV